MLKVLHVVGARPNFMKIAPLMAEMARYPNDFDQVLVHTGQHYDQEMSDIFFRDLGLATPDDFLGVGSGTHAAQTARTMLAFEETLIKHQPDVVVAAGDVNSTLACALVAAKLQIPVAHVEAGLRSFDRTMPEETNRVLTDHVSTWLFTPSSDAGANLAREGIVKPKIHFVGNVMIDSLVRILPGLDSGVPVQGVTAGEYCLVTLHRPSNVDDAGALRRVMGELSEIARMLPLIFAAHPRTAAAIERNAVELGPGVQLLPPLGYREFLTLERSAAIVITDSGGIQEETTYMGVPCITVRPNTERPVTIEQGTNHLVRPGVDNLPETAGKLLEAPRNNAEPPPYWDGHTAERIVEVFRR